MNDSTGVILGALTLLLFVIVYVWYALALAALFAKTGEATWKAWVPVLNVATVLKIGGFSPWLVLLNLIPLFGSIAYVVVSIVAIHRINLGFERGAGMTVLGALIPLVWASVLGFGTARWAAGATGVRRSGGVDENSAPVRRGQDFAGPYVPLVGGWTPEPSRSGDTGGTTDDGPAEAVSEPVVLPFAAPSGSLSDAVPSPSDWAPPTAAVFPPRADRADDEPSSATRSEASADVRDSVSEALAALRAPTDPPRAGTRPEAAHDDGDEASDAAPWPSAPLTPARPARAAATTPDIVAGPPPIEPAAPVASSSGDTVSIDEPRLDPWQAPSRRATEGDAPDAAAPLTRPAADAVPASDAVARDDEGPGEEFPELSEAVSAVSEAPQAGAPRSARTSVSALYTQPEFPADPDEADFDALDRTVVTRRRRIPWALVPPGGAPVDLTSDVVILGRRPAPDAAHPDAQLVAIADETRTVSKTHARLQLRGETWYVTDLDSTNGVLFATLMGTEVEAPPGEEIEAGERFFLGDAEVRLTRREP